MKNCIKNCLTALLIVLGLCCGIQSRAADTDLPLILTIKTNIYSYIGPDNSFTIYLGALKDNTDVYVEGPKTSELITVDRYTIGTDEEGSHSVIATAIPLSVTAADNTVRIYGDASQIDLIDLHGCYLNSVEFNGNFSNLSVLDLSHNELTYINLSSLRSLESIDLTDNAFTNGRNMIIGTNHPNLLILSVGINDVCDPNLNISNFPKLQYFSARNNYGVTQVDPSGCPNLVSLVLEVTNISSIDISKNQNLDVLNVSNTKINSIDLTKNPNLGEFYLSHEGSYNNNDEYKLTNIDLTKNTKLQYLDLSGNKLTSIDVTNNTELILLYLQRNLLKEINLDNNTKLANINLSNNLFTFATLPLPQEGWDYMYYRSPLPCNYKYKVGEPIDFSSEVLREGYETYVSVFVEPRAGMTDTIPQESPDYTFNNGVITFNKAYPDSVYLSFYCTGFPDWPLNTDLFMVKTAEDYDKPAPLFSFTTGEARNEHRVDLKIGGTPRSSQLSLPADITVMVNGKSTVFKNAVVASSLPSTANVSFTIPAAASEIEVMITDGYAATALAVNGISMTSIDVSDSEFLTDLEVTSCHLSSIDLSYNRALRFLDLSGNSLTTLDLSPVRADFEKYYLSTVNLAHNRLTSLSMVSYDLIRSLDLSNNNFSNFDLKYYTGLVNLDLSNNNLKGTLDLTKQVALQSLNLSGNKLTAIDFENWSNMVSLNLSNNNLSFATLPLLSNKNLTYTYAPQNPLAILSAGAAVNLSSQNVGDGTTYVWKYSDNNAEVPSSMYTIDNGATRFGSDLIDNMVYCEMTNGLFPAFNNSPLTTTPIKVLDVPTNLVAQFVTTQSGDASIGFGFANSDPNAVYIDWNGDGSQYDEYLYDSENTAIYRQGKSVAGKTVKVYSYGDPTVVTNLYLLNTKLSSLDASPMTKAKAIDIHGAGLTDNSLVLPESPDLYELVLDGNKFTSQTFPNLPALSNLNIANNAYKSIDLSIYPSLRFANLADNNIENVIFGSNNSLLYQIDLTGNELTSINLEGLPALAEILLADNNLTSIDVSPVKNQIRVLNVAGNRFTFKSLPRTSEFGSNFAVLYYANQQPIEVQCIDGEVDLSSQYMIEGQETDYRWFLGNRQSDVYYDAYNEMFVGEELEGPSVSSDPEYVCYDGVTYFRYLQDRKVIGAMTNAAYPNLILYTTPTEIDRVAGVEDVAVDNTENAPVNVYTISGVCLRRNVNPDAALEGLNPGLYIVGNRKVYVK